MKRLVFVLVAVLLLTVSAGCGYVSKAFGFKADEYEFSEEYYTGDFVCNKDRVDEVLVYWIAGEVLIGKGETELAVSEDAGAVKDIEPMKLHWLLKDRRLYIRFCESGYRLEDAFLNYEKKLNLTLPDGVKLTVRTTSAMLRAEALELKAAALRSVSGNIKLEKVNCREEMLVLESVSGLIAFDELYCSEIKLFSTSGSIIGNAVQGENVKIETTSGSVRIDRELCCENLNVKSVSGKFEASSLNVGEGAIKTTSGGVAVDLTSAKSLIINTVSGEVLVNASEGGMTFVFSTVSGDLICDSYSVRNWKYIIGNGVSFLEVETVSGNLKVNRL